MVEDTEAPSRIRIFFKRYWPYLFVPVFLAGAWFYLSSLPPVYRVTAKVELKGVGASAATNGIKSRLLIEKTLGQLPFNVSYYNDTLPGKELYPDSVPLKLVFRGITNFNPETRIEIQATQGGQVALTNGDTIVNYNLGEMITESYAKFKVVHNPLAKPDNQTYIIKINDTTKQADRFYNDLKIGADGNSNVLTVSLLTSNPKIGSDFVNKLLSLYNQANPPVPVSNTPIQATVPEKPDTVTIDEPQRPAVNIAALREKADRLDSEIADLKVRQKNGDDVADEAIKPTSTTDPAKMYQEMKPYAKKPVSEYVQVPHQDEIDDPDLNDEVSQYNEAQSYRRDLMANASKNKTQIDSLGRRLMVLQSTIVQKLNADIKNTPAKLERRPVHTDIKEQIRAKQEALAKVNQDIKDAARNTNDRPHEKKTVKPVLAKVKPVVNVPQQAALPVLTITDKPENNIKRVPPNALMIYGIALLAALAIPFGRRIVVRIWKIGETQAVIEKEKITERVRDIFSVRQID